MYLNHPKRLVLILLVIVFSVVFIHFYKIFAYKTPHYYYSIINSQEHVNADTKLTDTDKQNLENCKKEGDDCYRHFYDTYTMKYGVQEAFSHLALVQQVYPELLPSCHYISHGIGHASFRLNKNELYKSFGMLQDSDFFKNIATCGNGYFHGVIEEYARKAKNEDDLVELLNGVCDSKGIAEVAPCFHGIGHAIVVQLNYDLEKSVNVCDRITNKPSSLFDCHTGAFMEAITRDVVTFKNGKFDLNVCDSYDKKYQPACYMEHTSLFENFFTEPYEYTRNVRMCKTISDKINRLSCIKLNAIRAVRIAHYEKISQMCDSTSNGTERVACYAIIASRIAASQDLKFDSESYVLVLRDICSLSGFVSKYSCMNMVLNHGNRLFWTDEGDFKIPAPSLSFVWEQIKSEGIYVYKKII